MFSITQGKGFQVQFPNGWTASVQFGPANYGDNHDAEISDASSIRCGKLGSATAEIAAWHRDAGRRSLAKMNGGDTVEGYVEPMAVLEFLNTVAALPDTPDVPPLAVRRSVL